MDGKYKNEFIVNKTVNRNQFGGVRAAAAAVYNNTKSATVRPARKARSAIRQAAGSLTSERTTLDYVQQNNTTIYERLIRSGYSVCAYLPLATCLIKKKDK